MANVGYATLRVIPSMEGMGKALKGDIKRSNLKGIGQQAGGQIGDSAGKGFAKRFALLAAGAIAAVGVGKGLKAIGGAAIDMNSELETSTLQFETLMGDADAAKEHVEGLFEFAGSTPFETGPIIEASKHLQVFGGEALNTDDNLRLVGDAAAAMGQPMDDVAFWVGRATNAIDAGRPFGEASSRLQEMGVLTAEARAEMEEMQAAGASSDEIFNTLTEDLGRTAGAMEKQAGTWGGLTSTIKDNVQILNATALKPMFDLVKDVAGRVAEFVQSDAAKEWAENFAESFQGLIDTGKEFVSGFMDEFNRLRDEGSGVVGAAFGAIKEGISDAFGGDGFDIGDFLSGLVETIQDAIAGVVDWLSSGGIKMIAKAFVEGRERLFDAALTLFPVVVDALIEIIPQLLTAVVEVVGTLAKLLITQVPIMLDAAVTLFQGLLKAVIELLPVVINTLMSLIPMVVGVLVNAVPQLLAAALSAFTSLVSAVVEVLPVVLEALTGALPKLVEAILGMLPDILEAALSVFTSLVDAVIEIVPVVLEALMDALPQLIETILGMIPDILEAAVDLFMMLVDAVLTILPDLLTTLLTKVLPDLLTTILGMLPEILDAAITTFFALVTAILDVLPDLLTTLLTDVLPEVLDTLVKMIPELLDTATTVFLALGDGVMDALPDILHTLAFDVIPELLDAFSDVPDMLFDAGKDIVTGLWDGLKSMWGRVTGWVGEQIDKIPGAVKSLLGISSPSKVFMEIGEDTLGGFHEGLKNQIGATQDLLESALAPPTVAPLQVDRGPEPELEAAGVGAGRGPLDGATFNLQGTPDELVEMVGNRVAEEARFMS